MTTMARLPCKQSSSPSQQPRVNNFGNSRNPYWDMQQARHPAPPYVRNHHRHTDHTGENQTNALRIASRIDASGTVDVCVFEKEAINLCAYFESF